MPVFQGIWRILKCCGNIPNYTIFRGDLYCGQISISYTLNTVKSPVSSVYGGCVSSNSFRFTRYASISSLVSNRPFSFNLHSGKTNGISL